MVGEQHGETLKEAGFCHHGQAKHPLPGITSQSGVHLREAELASHGEFRALFANIAGQFPLYLRACGHRRHSPFLKRLTLWRAAQISQE